MTEQDLHHGSKRLPSKLAVWAAAGGGWLRELSRHRHALQKCGSTTQHSYRCDVQCCSHVSHGRQVGCILARQAECVQDRKAGGWVMKHLHLHWLQKSTPQHDHTAHVQGLTEKQERAIDRQAGCECVCVCRCWVGEVKEIELWCFGELRFRISYCHFWLGVG